MIRFLAIISTSFLFLSSLAFAKTPDERISVLEQQLAALQRTYSANNADVASSLESVRAMQDEFNGIKGQVEASNHILQSQRDEFMRLIQDLQQRMGMLEERMGVVSSQAASTSKTDAKGSAEAEQYQRALEMAHSGRYLEAAAELESFLQKYPKSQFAPNARAWVGESFYMSRDYKRAIKEFQTFIEKYPKDAKVPDAILKQGNSFYELGMMDEARAFYEKVIQSYSNSPEAKQAKSKLNRIEERKSGKGGTSQALGNSSGTAPPGTSSPDGGMSSYPTETILQQRARMGGQATPTTPPPTTPPSTSTTSKPPKRHQDF